MSGECFYEETFETRKEENNFSLLKERLFSSFVPERERDNIKSRQAEGIGIAKTQGKHLGQPRLRLDTLSKKQLKTLNNNYEEWKSGNIKAIEFMKILNLKKNKFYGIVKGYEKELEILQ